MNKYHISPTTGRPNICRATVRACPIGGQDEHYSSADEARNAYETKMSDQTFQSVSKGSKKMKPLPQSVEYGLLTGGPALQASDPRVEAIQDRCVETVDSLMAVTKEKAAIVENKEGESDDVVLAKLSEVDRKSDELLKTLGDSGKEIRAIKNAEEVENFDKMFKSIEPELYHSDRSRISEVCTRDHKQSDRSYRHHSMFAGNLNPMQGEGTGAQYVRPDENSLVILSQADGKRPRVISSSGEFYPDPGETLGDRAWHVKQSRGRDRVTEDLHVVGYVSKSGERFGWIPNKKVPFFVYK